MTPLQARKIDRAECSLRLAIPRDGYDIPGKALCDGVVIDLSRVVNLDCGCFEKDERVMLSNLLSASGLEPSALITAKEWI